MHFAAIINFPVRQRNAKIWKTNVVTIGLLVWRDLKSVCLFSQRFKHITHICPLNQRFNHITHMLGTAFQPISIKRRPYRSEQNPECVLVANTELHYASFYISSIQNSWQDRFSAAHMFYINNGLNRQ